MAGYFHVCDHLADSMDEELGLYVAEGLEGVLAMSHFRMCVPHNTFGQDGFLADQRDSNLGWETAIRDLIHSIQMLDDEVFELVGGDDGFRCIRKTLNNEGEDGGFNRAPGSCRVGVPPPSSEAFVNEGEGCDHFGETLVVFKEADDKVGGRVGRPGCDEIDGSGRKIIQGHGRTVLDRPG